jgi:hypothetical protein
MENVKLGLATAMLSVVWLSDVVISNAPSEVDLVIVYANGREKCCANATATVTALGTGYERACLYGKSDVVLLLDYLIESLRSLRKAMSISALVAVAVKLKLGARQELPGALARDLARPIRVKGSIVGKHQIPVNDKHAAESAF